ncbi:hypothetical protein [Adhaeribacter soli]|uniref:CcoQ/FixQ family Cbb3-type cytochrome c oxidase assembly chaperone n=1 Tax=Adhaeribacter soli TaxID=2607655 RepID=A0A5N1J4A0_9BACT|nr:hypothetical protein [Adhaeribacter soli]KAA9345731.1 hypothetical protein F0P94_01200 [Adhaeribacter soli]
MYKNVLQSITGIEIFPVISFVIFFAFFLGLLLYVVFSDKKHLAAMSELPLRNENQPQLANELLQ